MKYMEKNIEELHELLEKKEVTSEELIKESLEKSREVQDKYNAFITILDSPKQTSVTKELLSGIPYGVKDNYSTEGVLSTGGSNTLNDYIPFFTATAVKNLEKCGAIMVNKTNMDEFGMGGTGTTGYTGITLNPWDTKRMCAGSSSGSACAVAAGVYPYALGSDTGDSIRKPAAYCGIVGYKPTYGMISRYGLFAFASSLDHCGVLTRTVKDAAIVVDGMKGLDPNDMTTWDSKDINLYKSINGNVKGKKVCYIKEYTDISMFPNANKELKEHLENFFEKIELCKKLGMEVDCVSVSKKLLDAVSSTYRVISCAEATSNMSNLTGIIFGPRAKGDSYEEIMKNYRTNGFSPLIKRRFVIGSYVLQEENKDRYFFNAGRVRRLLVSKWKEIFKEYDAVILPVGRGPAIHFDSSLDNYDKESEYIEDHLQIGNFGGFPSITIPSGFISELPVGLNITGNVYDDSNVLNIAYAMESAMNYKNQIAKEVNHE